MTVKLLTQWGQQPPGTLFASTAQTETAMVADKVATTDLTGGVAWNPPQGSLGEIAALNAQALQLTPSGLRVGGAAPSAEQAAVLQNDLGIAAVGSAFKGGGAGKKYAFVAGVIRNYDTAANGTGSSGWELIDDGYHPPVGIDSVDSLTDTTLIEIDYSSLGAARTVSVVAVPDETLAAAGFVCGASVEPDVCRIKIGRVVELADYLYYDTGTSTFKLDNREQGIVPSGNRLEIASVSGADVTISHPKLTNADRFGFSFTARPGSGGVLYTPVIASDVGPSSSLSQFELNWYNGSTKVTSPDGNCRACVSRGHTSVEVLPNTINTTTYPNGNIWIIGILEL